jgi:molecular chaperone HtpG
VRGIIDSSDLPLNVSREILQQSQDVEAIRAGSVKRVLGLLEDLASNHADTYASFWHEFGNVFKEGMGEDAANRDRIAKLLRFASTTAESDQPAVGLADYVGRMKEGQQAIYYITAETPAAAAHSPHLEIFRKKGIEVLLLHDRVDEWVVAHLHEFDGKPLQSVAKGDLDLGTLADPVEATADANHETEHRALVDRIKHALVDRAKDVRLTRRLTDSPACLVSERDGMSTNLERMLKAAGQAVPVAKPILEINADHPLLKRMALETNEAQLADWSHVLFDQALLAEGGQLGDPAAFVKRLNALMLGLAGEGGPKIWMPGA